MTLTGTVSAGPEGAYVATRQTLAGGDGPLVAYDPAGTGRWDRAGQIIRVAADGLGHVLIETTPGLELLDSSGASIWTKTITSTATMERLVERIAPTPHGGFILTGVLDPGTMIDFGDAAVSAPTGSFKSVYVALIGPDATTKWLQLLPSSGAAIAALDDDTAIVCVGPANAGMMQIASSGVQTLIDGVTCTPIAQGPNGTFWTEVQVEGPTTSMTVADRTLNGSGTYFLEIAL